MVYVGSDDGKVYALTGEISWRLGGCELLFIALPNSG